MKTGNHVDLDAGQYVAIGAIETLSDNGLTTESTFTKFGNPEGGRGDKIRCCDVWVGGL
jgi:hypothetical protein